MVDREAGTRRHVSVSVRLRDAENDVLSLRLRRREQRRTRDLGLKRSPPAKLLLSRRRRLHALFLKHERSDPPQRHPHGGVVHVGEADAEPPRLGAMERAAVGNVELHFIDYDAPELQLGLEARLLEKPPQIHPREQPRVAGQRAYADLREPPRKRGVSRPEPLRALPHEFLHENLVRQHGRDQVEIDREFLDNLGNADEFRAIEHRGGVDFVADEVDVLVGDETHHIS
nr:hypothetical protein TorRG33x02_037030 [Ipomoea batatas]